MIYKSKFNLTGTDFQQQIVMEALDQIMFPWDKLKFPSEPVEIGWRVLNSNSSVGEDSLPIKKHQGHHPEDPDNPDYIEGKLEGRKYILGVFYPGSGRIYIDSLLANHPAVAKSTVSAEIAHAVDYFLPLTDKQRNSIMTLMHGGDSTEHGHSWWEKFDYGKEYYTLVGESFMQAFTLAYSDMPFGNAQDFTHTLKPEQAPILRTIIGIERTDLVTTSTTTSSTQASTTTSTTEIPTTTSTTTESPSTTTTTSESQLTEYEVFPHSKVYHRLSHYDKPNRIGKIITDTTGYRPCKVCKP